ncbi:uncharacterized protein LOC106871694 [Octopus bimaculoides]|uniref:uncharacterized protein LOC106871694 n=1 Tax=Octopus bimaculoides TaxID=37653 RepID=UPI00071C9AD5|nr:uncharacterized protein LOC106871694 [Octopus bimaculoides]|eukprot:XP_014773787.1 PREDICTED: uncharacterized protein LOC106871694 [Octopus bimaculoides]
MLNVVASAARKGQVPELSLHKTAFVKQGVMPKGQKPRQAEERKWEVFVDKPLPESIVVSALRPDLMLVDGGQRRMVLGELTVPWEERIAEAHERKLLGYEELVVEIQEKGYICELVDCKGFTAASLRSFLKVAGVSAARKTFNEFGEKAVEVSAWIARRFVNAYKATEPS